MNWQRLSKLAKPLLSTSASRYAAGNGRNRNRHAAIHLPFSIGAAPRLLQMTPPERRALVRQWRRNKYSALRKELPVRNIEVMKLNMAPVGVRLTLPARSIERLRRLRNVGSISVCSIKGVRAKNSTQIRSRSYAVTGRMAFQVEGQTRGTQLCEERITIVTARSEHVARARVARIMNTESFPYLSISGHFVRWGFEGIIDICECPDENLSSRSTEVFYRYKKRRVNTKNEWHLRADK